MLKQWFTKTSVFLLAIFLFVNGCSNKDENKISQSLNKRPKAPFKVLFSNDFTNIVTCTSPYHEKGQRWTPEMLQATVDETAGTGIEVHMLQPAHTWVPWWQSKVYSMQEHYKWWEEKYGYKPSMDIHEYIIKGGDPLKVFVTRCREKDISPFISLRLNDGHHLENVDVPNNKKGQHAICKFYADHPEYKIGPDVKDWYQHVQNWAIPEVRDYKFKLIKEVCENYDIDGMELDFMRHCSFFQLDKTTSEQRAKIITDFIADVREVLNKTAKPGQYRWLCVRVPCFIAAFDALGVDLPNWVEAGVDMVNLSPYYFTEQQTDMGAIKKMVPNASVYIEMCHATRTGKRVGPKGAYDAFSFRRTSENQYYTTAHLAYEQGLDGVSAFNFVYYREHGKGERGPFNEPPFNIFNNIAKPDWLANQPQHYIISAVWNNPPIPNRQLPKTFEANQSETFTMNMAPPAAGWRTHGKLRIQADDLLDPNSQWSAKFNGVQLQANTNVSEPYHTPFVPLLGTAQQHRGWIVPTDLLKAGENNIEITMTKGQKPAKIVFIDLAIK